MEKIKKYKEIYAFITIIIGILSGAFVILHNILNKYDEILDNLKTTQQMSLKSVIWNDNIPLAERSSACDVYLSNGYNSLTKKHSEGGIIMIKIIIGLVSVMIANVLLGVTLAKLKQEFKKEKLLSGLVKYLGIVLGVLLMYLTGYLNPDIVVANINNVEVNLMTGIEVLFISGIIYYGMQDLIKLKNLLGLSNDITPTDEGRG